MPRQELRRLRNRTLSGLDSLRLGEQVNSYIIIIFSLFIQARERSHSLTGERHSLTMSGLHSSTGPRTPCTPTFANEKDAITNFVDFNPADFVKYKIDR